MKCLHWIGVGRGCNAFCLHYRYGTGKVGLALNLVTGNDNLVEVVVGFKKLNLHIPGSCQFLTGVTNIGEDYRRTLGCRKGEVAIKVCNGTIAGSFLNY